MLNRSMLAALLLAAMATPAAAGPPYVTDDPVPAEQGQFEVHSYVEGARVSGVTEGEAGFDINYGIAKDTQLTIVLPLGFEHEHSWHKGVGDPAVGLKYLFLHQEGDGAAGLDVAFYPEITVPVGGRFGSKKVGVFLPLWAQKDYGPWSVFGGGGYQINPGAENKNFWEGGLAVTRNITEKLNLGVEVYHQTAEEVGGRAYTGSNIGVVYELNDHWALEASGGPGLQNRDEGGKYHFFVGVRSEF